MPPPETLQLKLLEKLTARYWTAEPAGQERRAGVDAAGGLVVVDGAAGDVAVEVAREARGVIAGQTADPAAREARSRVGLRARTSRSGVREVLDAIAPCKPAGRRSGGPVVYLLPGWTRTCN